MAAWSELLQGRQGPHSRTMGMGIAAEVFHARLPMSCTTAVKAAELAVVTVY